MTCLNEEILFYEVNVISSVSSNETCPGLLVKNERKKSNKPIVKWFNKEQTLKVLKKAKGKFPFFIIMLSTIQILIYSTDTNGEACTILRYSKFHKEEIWRIFTYILIHKNKIHLISNLTSEILFGINIEISQGTMRIITIQLVGAASGCLGTYAFDPSFRSLIGASASCYALLIAYIIHLILNHKRIMFWRQQLMMVGSMLVIDIVFSSTNLDEKFYSSSQHLSKLFGSDGQICKVSHYCGAIGGLLVSLIILKGGEEWEKKNETILRRSRVTGIAFMSFMLGYAICYFFTKKNEIK